MFGDNKQIAYIPNAFDFSAVSPPRKKGHIDKDLESLRALGLLPEILDLRDYVNKKHDLQKKLESFAGLWISGGNVFVLRQAMKLSGLDELLSIELSNRKDFVYGGYSAAGCVLSPSLECYKIVDNPEVPYEELKEIIWEGLGLLDFAFMPHYDSDHPESADITKEIELCKKLSIPYKAIRDGEVLIL